MNQELEGLGNKPYEWRELDALNRKASGGFKRLTGDEIARMISLYRKASADLAGMTGSNANPELADWLNLVVSKSYGLLYRAPRRTLGENIARTAWVAADTVRRNAVFVFVALGLFLFFAVFAGALSSVSPGAREVMVPPGWEEVFEHWTSGRHDARTGSEAFGATIGYATNNPTVGIAANALTVATAGLFGIYSMYQNGALIGVLAVDTARAGTLGFLLSSIFPHGVSELGGIWVCTGAGFMLGWAILKPGRKSRWLKLYESGKDAAVMMIVGLVMIFAAAPIEGYFSFNPAIPQSWKVVFGVVATVGWLAYFIGYGKSGPPAGFTVEELRPRRDPD